MFIIQQVNVCRFAYERPCRNTLYIRKEIVEPPKSGQGSADEGHADVHFCILCNQARISIHEIGHFIAKNR